MKSLLLPSSHHKCAVNPSAQQATAHDVEEAAEGLVLNMVVKRGNVWGIFQLFGDTGVTYASPEVPNRGEVFFFDGGIDLFFTARVGDHFQALSETVFLTAIGTTSDTSKFDQERLWGAWKFSDILQLKIGLEHGPISRWNNLYHHGRWLELTITRPFLARLSGCVWAARSGRLHPCLGWRATHSSAQLRRAPVFGSV